MMKIIYDRGSPKQLFEPHYMVPESEYTGKAVGLPASHEIPNIDLQVMNYHRPLLGTFHAKYMIVDRRVAVLQSNNIQDNDNLEMMVELEGRIVDSMYDMALLSWHKKLEPPLPNLGSPAAASGSGTFDPSHSSIFSEYGAIKGHAAVIDPDKLPRDVSSLEYLELKRQGGPQYADGIDGSTTGNAGKSPSNLQSQSQDGNATGSRDHNGQSSHTDGTPDMEETPIPLNQLLEHTAEDPHYDKNLAEEIQRIQASVSPTPGESQMQAVSRHLNHTVNKGFEGSAPECDTRDEMTPYLPHPAHEPFPMAMVCRWPYGIPYHVSVSNPQNAAWLSALQNAKTNVFIQTPTLNAEPLIPAIVEACERGVDVYCYVCLGYNDSVSFLYLPTSLPR